MILLERYNLLVAQGDIDDDPEQRVVLVQLQRLATDLEEKPSFWWFWRNKKIKGLYIYGTVGTGKTYLIDLFYALIKEEKKARFHFHHFMQQIDAQLRRLQGQKNPLRTVAKEIAQKTKLICFDEFLVDDVAYAMILAQLLHALLQEGVVLVISSNTKPNDLYAKGVQRARFLPAINLINSNCDVIKLSKKRDYRLGRMPLLDAYLHPINTKTMQKMTEQFAMLTPNAQSNQTISIQNRPIAFLKSGAQAIWFDFDVLCNLPRSQLDYLEIASKFDHLFISGLTQLELRTVQAIMFINLIDVMYDRGIDTVIAAEVAMEQLYTQGELEVPFKRTLSRLNEMQSVDYLARHPRREVYDII